MSVSAGRAEAERRIDEVQAIVAQMVRKEVKSSPYHEVDDLIQDGMVGVFLHIDKWDPTRSNLRTFVWMTARSWVFGRILKRDTYDCHKVNLHKLSLDAPMLRSKTPHGRDRLLGEVVPSDYDIEDDVSKRVDAQRAVEALDSLGDKRIKEIVLKRYIIDGGRTLREIGQELGVSHQRVKQLEKIGINRLQVMLKGK